MKKPLGRKNYGSIPHLPDSRSGPGDHHCDEGQARIATVRTRDKHDTVIVQEKLDGSNVGVARIDDTLYPITRAGYLATTSPYAQHHHFAKWVYANADRILKVLRPGERLVGEWLMQAHGTRYALTHEPFVAIDIMTDTMRLPYAKFRERIFPRFISPRVVYVGQEALSIQDAMAELVSYNQHGWHGALEPVEGAVWRVERDKLVRGTKTRERVVDFLVKYVRPDKEDGKYLDQEIWNWFPESESDYVTNPWSGCVTRDADTPAIRAWLTGARRTWGARGA